MGDDAIARRVGRRFDVRGTVQGVGYRPFVYRLATELGVDGSVRNAGGHVIVEAAADAGSLAELGRRLASDAPPLAQVLTVTQGELVAPPPQGVGFHIDGSQFATEAVRAIPPDVATCDDCLAELIDPTDRRYRYPFINCTNCGPRATIIDDLPYDRARTAMHTFEMCADCRREYEDPHDRRFHAEPVACPNCGPVLVWRRTGEAPHSTGNCALLMAENAIEQGAVIAVKALGGYQLVCDATRPDVVARLRRLKHRYGKPLAVMVGDLAAARAIAELTPEEVDVMTSPARPIVLAQARDHSRLAPSVHEGTSRVGVFLPNTALHYLLTADLGRPLVVTSGNRADEPMAIDDEAALATLDGVADGFLQHDRPIRSRYDDSVVQVVGTEPRLVRRARGYAPQSRSLPFAAQPPVLAVGAELKHTFTLAAGHTAVVSPHIGDLESVEALDSFTAAVRHLERVVAITPEIVVHDLHPSYLSTQYARTWPARQRLAVQHHHAHLAGCAAEFGLTTPFIGVAYDGLGMGDDGTFWGGEFLVADLEQYRRVGRFSRAPLVGGAAAVKRPVRMALGYLLAAETFLPSGSSGFAAYALRRAVDDVLERVDDREVEFVNRMVAGNLNCPQASSTGRLFDAVSSLLGLCDEARFEGEAAIALENVAVAEESEELPWHVQHAGDLWVYDVRRTLLGVVDSVRSGVTAGVTAARFHRTIVAVTAAMCDLVRRDTGLATVCLSGGVFQNRLLATGVSQSLREQGFEVYLGEQVPANDGGISFGQAAVAAARTRRR
jgi:hydrogenase maturation protein HypF